MPGVRKNVASGHLLSVTPPCTKGSNFRRTAVKVRRLVNGPFDDIRRAVLEFNRKALLWKCPSSFPPPGIEISGEKWLIAIYAELEAYINVNNEETACTAPMPSVEAPPDAARRPRRLP
jgi:hypothetical protein